MHLLSRKLMGGAGSLCRKIGPQARRLVADRRGSTLALMAAGLIPVIAALGAGVDAG